MSENTKHTPGPWTVAKPTVRWRIEANQCVIPALRDVATVYCGASDEQDKANAQLIAAAPELLEACKMMIDRLDLADGLTHIDDRHYEQIRAAIAKAEGK